MSARKTGIIPKAPVARILMKAGAKRVSVDAVNVFTETIEEIAEEIGQQAVMISKHAGRKTVQDGDIKLAAKKM